MAQWDGRGLPPVAQARIDRARADGVRTSLLSTDATVSLGSVGFDAVGEVMGCVVESVGWSGYGGCGWMGMGYGGGFGGMLGGYSTPPPVIGTRDSRFAAFRPYADAIRRGYGTALSRLLQEAAALGADGVVGIRLSVSMLDGAREFMAIGTAVRGRTATRPARPFTTDLSGSDVAKLLLAGWVPDCLLYAFDLAIRHDDWRTMGQASSWSNTEISGYTELITYVRHVVRTDIAEQAARLRSDGFISSAMTLRIFEVEPGENHRDHVAESLMVGTAIARYTRQAHPLTDSRTLVPLGGMIPTRRR